MARSPAPRLPDAGAARDRAEAGGGEQRDHELRAVAEQERTRSPARHPAGGHAGSQALDQPG